MALFRRNGPDLMKLETKFKIAATGAFWLVAVGMSFGVLGSALGPLGFGSTYSFGVWYGISYLFMIAAVIGAATAGTVFVWHREK